MQIIEQGGYTRQQIIDALHAKHASRLIKFRYDLLNRQEIKIGTLDNVVSGEVSMASLATDIKRTARFYMKENRDIDWLNDRVQPFCMFRMPDGGWVEWSLGIFLLNSPKRKEQNRQVYRDIEAYDGLQVLLDDKFDSRYTISSGTKYITAINNIFFTLGITKINIPNTDLTLSITKEFEIGTPKLRAINELLGELNYTSLWVDERGYYTAMPYIIPSDRAIEYAYKDDELSVIYNGLEEELDLFSVPNKFVVVQSNAETEPLTSTYTNENPGSITSTVSRGRTIVDVREVDNIADQTALDNYTKRIAFEASQVYGHIEFETAIMPMHSYSDLLHIQYSSLGINDRYVETNWTIPLQAGGRMKHSARKVVAI